MFAKEVYVRRRATLLRKMQEAGAKGLILFVGNAEAPAQYKDNCYKWRQDSSWLYFMGLDEPLMAALLDIDAGTETLFADDVDIDDIIWMGPQPSVRSKADAVGVAQTQPYGALEATVAKALAAGRTLHFLPPSRYYNTLKLQQLVPGRKPSEALIKAVISLRLVKEDIEIEAIDAACALGYEMHSVARDAIVPGIIEQDILVSSNRTSWAKWKAWRWPKVGACPSPPSLPSTGKPCTTIFMTRLLSPAS